LYRRKLPKVVADALRRGKSKGRSAFGTLFTIWYTMQSGMPDTAVGDSIINAAMYFYIHGIGRKWLIIVCGDDTVCVTTDREIARLGGRHGIEAAYTRLGMQVECIVRKDPLCAEFCSARFFPVGESFVLFPKIGKLMAKLACDSVDRSPKNQIAWLRGISATLKTFGNVDELCDALGQAIATFCGEGKIIHERYNEYKAWIKKDHRAEVQRLDRLSYYSLHYGMDELAYDALLATLRQPFYLGRVYRSSWWEHMVAVDLA